VTLALMTLVVIALFTAPQYLADDYQVRILVLVCIFGAASVGWNLLGGYANQVSLGHGVFFGVGAYAVVIFQGTLGLSPWLAMPVGVVVSLVAALLIGWPTFQLSGHYFALGTLALLQIFDIVARYWKGLTGGPAGITLPILPSSVWNLQFDRPASYLYIAIVLLLVSLAVGRWVRYSRLGLQLDAIRQNPQAAALAGVDLFRAKMKSLLLSAVIVSLCGSLYASFLQFLDPDTAFSFNTSINMALFAIVGGVGYWWGPFVGALILIPLGEVASDRLTGNAAALGQLSYGLLLIILILLQPRGVGGWLNNLWRAVTREGK
jgi:branched-chain amino acid transport system permease protein